MIKKFDGMNNRIDETNNRITKLEKSMNEGFNKMDRRFDNIERGIKDLSEKVSKLATEFKTSVRDYIIERDRYYDRKFNNLRLFIIALLVGVGGLFLKVIGFFDKLFK